MFDDLSESCQKYLFLNNLGSNLSPWRGLLAILFDNLGNFSVAMYFIRFANSTSQFNAIIKRQVRFFARDPFPNKVQHYLHRARLIDSIRVGLRSDSPELLTSLLNHRLLDSFVVKHALRSSPSVDSAWSIFKTLQQNSQFSLDFNTLHAFATVLAKFQRVSELKSLIGVTNAGKFGNFRFSFMNLMKWYAIAGDFDSVLQTWNEYREKEKTVCAESYNIVMQIYANRGQNLEALEIFYRMMDEGAIPNSRTYTILMEHLVTLGKLDSAMEVFKLLPLMRVTRTLKHYSVLIEGFVAKERFGEVKILIDEMKADGKFPSRNMLEPLQHMKEAGFVQETKEFLREMSPNEQIKDIYGCYVDGSDDDDEDENHHDDDDGRDDRVHEVKLKPWMDPKALASALKQWKPEVVSVLEDAKFVWTNRLVCKVLRNFRQPATAWSFFCWVAYRPGFTHDAYTVERMMTLLARHGHAELVDKLISKVRTEGIKLPFSTIRLIIDLFGISKKPDAAIKVFRYDRTLCGPISNSNLMLLCSSLLRTLTKCRKNAEALDILDEMILNGTCLDIQTFSGLMYHFALQGDIKTVQKLFSMARQIGIEPDAYMLKILVQAYCRCERAVLAFRVFEDMRNSNLMIDKQTKELLVKSLWNEGKRKEAVLVEESCEEGNNVLALALTGHVWAVSSANLSKIYDIYSSVAQTSIVL